MTFGPINGPMVFIVFIHDMESTWKGVATTRGIVIDAKTGMRLIVDEIYSWDHSFEDFIEYLKCQLDVCLSQNISLSLKKCLFCPERMEFVSHDVCINGNCPTQLKNPLMKTWPPFEVDRYVASFLGFLNFYSMYIPYFEQRVTYLCTLANFDMDHDITAISRSL